MFTRKTFNPPEAVDAKSVLDAVAKWILGLNDKAALEITQARIYVDQGLQFPATQVASTDANNLDDYEEGTWTPSDGSGAGLALTITSATYTKIGRLVLAQCHVVYPATASGANAQLNGLPFSAPNIHAGALYSNGAGGGTVAQINGTAINPYAPGGVALTNANLTGAFVVVTCAYSI